MTEELVTVLRRLAQLEEELATVKKLAEGTAAKLARFLEPDPESEGASLDPVEDQSKRWMERMRQREQSRQQRNTEAVR